MNAGRLNVLFVDDEDHLLAGLRRSLHNLRGQWQMAFVNSGVAALNHLAEYPVDIIVTDMKMPGMDGAELLQVVATRYPSIVRLILSGQSNEELILKASSYAHQYLAKPVTADGIRKTIDHIRVVRQKVHNQQLIKFVTGLKTLPVLPEMYLRVEKKLQSPDVDLHEISDLISADISLTAQILKYVNSAFFGFGHPMKNLHQAVVYLGIRTLKALVLSESLFAQRSDLDPEQVRYTASLSLHSKRVAALMERMSCELLDKEQCREALLIGILHDIGKLLLTSCPQERERIQQLITEHNLPTVTAELQVLGTSHQELGSYLLGLWNFPESIVAGAAYHHQPSLVQHSGPDILTILHLVDAYTNFREKSGTGLGGPLYDHAYLESVGWYDRLPELEIKMIQYYEDICHEK